MRSIIQHLRFPFSYLLFPVFLLAISILPAYHGNYFQIVLLFLILHVLVYPSSNAYNSVQDRDTSSIGLVKNPLKANRNLLWISIVLDSIAILLSILISLETALFIFTYILASRLYSYRKIRLKKYPIIGFLIVFIFQGAWMFFTVSTGLGTIFVMLESSFWPYLFSASCLIGSIYPLSQIYQHESDKADGVITISYLLGKKGTFIFSGLLFLVGSILLLLPLIKTSGLDYILIYIAFQLPSLIFFNYWFFKVIKDENQANFKNTMIMSLLSATCMNAYFIYWICAMST